MQGKRLVRNAHPYGMCTLQTVGLVDFLIRDVGVDFLGEVVVFAVHL